MSRLTSIFRNLKIGTKLAIISGLTVLLIAATTAAQLMGAGKVSASNDAASARMEVARDVMAAKAAIRGFQIGVRELRLARSPAELRNASDSIRSQHQVAHRYVDALSEKDVSAETKETLTNINNLVNEYIKRTQEISAKKLEIFGADKKAADQNMTSSELAAYVADLNEEIFRLVRLRLTAMAAEIDSMIDKVDETVSQQAMERRQFTAETSRAVSMIVILLAGVAIILSLCTALFAVATIARPMRALTAGMHELAEGNFDVTLPGLGRKDEIGDIARAVETFKLKSAENAQANADRELQIATARAERERMATEERAAHEREAAAARDQALVLVMQEFDTAVGGIAKAAMAGDFSQRVPLEGKEGVIRSLAASMNRMCDDIGRVLDDLVGMLSAMADGDLTRRIDGSYDGTFAVLKDAANVTAEGLSQTIAEIKVVAAEVSNAAAEIAISTTDLSQRTEEQAAGLEQTSASMEEISVTVRKNAENARQATNLAVGTQKVADRGGAIVAETVGAMARIEESSRKISNIIGVIDEIARQTNLLALNAAVEAARAGEAGRGFAVVAAEVRSLAQRSSQAAKDIKDLITSSTGQVKEGVDLVNRAGKSLNEIVESIKTVSEIVADIATASAEQATGIDQIKHALNQMDEVTQQNSALVEQNAATAKTLEAQSAAMDERVSAFRVATNGSAPHIAVRPSPATTNATLRSAAVRAPMRPARNAAGRGGPVGRLQAGIASAYKLDTDFEEF